MAPRPACGHDIGEGPPYGVISGTCSPTSWGRLHQRSPAGGAAVLCGGPRRNAGFDAIAGANHRTPGAELGGRAPVDCANPWPWLGAGARATKRIGLGTGADGRDHVEYPWSVAEQVATLEGAGTWLRTFGVGSSEAMNEVPGGSGPAADRRGARRHRGGAVDDRAAASTARETPVTGWDLPHSSGRLSYGLARAAAADLRGRLGSTRRWAEVVAVAR